MKKLDITEKMLTKIADLREQILFDEQSDSTVANMLVNTGQEINYENVKSALCIILEDVDEGEGCL